MSGIVLQGAPAGGGAAGGGAARGGAGRAAGLVAAAREVAVGVLAPAARACDSGEVPAAHLRVLAEAGLLGLTADDVPDAIGREVQEILAGACLATWFVALQHHGPTRRIRRVADAGRSTFTVGQRVWDAGELTTALLAGDQVAGTAFAHLRRPARPVRAVRVHGGWRFEGRVAWYTGWGLNDLMQLAAAADDGSAVFGLVPAVASPSLVAGPVQRPLAMGGTRTVSLELRGLFVPDNGVLEILSGPEFAHADSLATANANPAVFGLCAAALDGLRLSGGRAGEAATVLEQRRVDLRSRAWRLMDDSPPDERVDERLAVRAEAGELAVRAATAEVVSAGGRGLVPGHPAERHAREALFLLTQAQTAALRTAQLGALAG